MSGEEWLEETMPTDGGFDLIDPRDRRERAETAQDIRAMRTANYEGRQSIMRAMRGLHRWTREAAEAYEEAGGDTRPTLNAALLVADRDRRVRQAERERSSDLILQLKERLDLDPQEPIAVAIASVLDAARVLVVGEPEPSDSGGES